MKIKSPILVAMIACFAWSQAAGNDHSSALRIVGMNQNSAGDAGTLVVSTFSAGFLGETRGGNTVVSSGLLMQAPEETVETTEGTLSPAEFHLYQNFPNPFNPSTTINYDLPVDSHVTLKIYDILGEEVRTLTDVAEEAGYKSVVWNSNDNAGKPVASGVYFLRIEATAAGHNSIAFRQVRKMLIIR